MRKGQAAMEFLMTYGWTILVVIAAIGALYYFGVLNPDNFLPEKCTLPSGMACLNFQTVDEGFVLSIQNAAYFDMNNVVVTIEDYDNNVYCDKANVTPFKDGEIINFFILCNFFNTESYKFKGEIIINYTNSITGYNHTKTGELIAKI